MSKAGVKGYVKTNVFFTTYDEALAEEILKLIESKYKVLEKHRSRVTNDFYFVSIEGNAEDLEELLKGKVSWFKVDVLVFR
ncbi:MAG: hypothetical protein B7O98_06220 [Zestosphaera tikiterensis]|uniref:Transcription regulator AsnC/Lrp ligand binding domain-containing protein n=1 Tax=Zestosphaera tikiterensis TaxID=1973259 RepID=A0A2R7Y420_9CREN|nr:MAG: hypothetical protein B7O98_06220 [Zestosphaera tikiterensis]